MHGLDTRPYHGKLKIGVTFMFWRDQNSLFWTFQEHINFDDNFKMSETKNQDFKFGINLGRQRKRGKNIEKYTPKERERDVWVVMGMKKIDVSIMDRDG